MKKALLKREDLVYPELSYQIVGVLFDVYNKLGHGFDEKTYQRAVAISLRNLGVAFSEQVYIPLEFEGEKIGRNYFDFLVDDKVVVEIKRGDRFSKSHMDQVIKYLKSNDLKLGILAYFGPSKLHFKRIVNL